MFKRKNKKYSAEQVFEYCIENVDNEATFIEQCNNLKGNLLDLMDDGVHVSEDNKSIMQFFIYKDMEITVMYDSDLQEVYVSSPIDIIEFIIQSKG